MPDGDDDLLPRLLRQLGTSTTVAVQLPPGNGQKYYPDNCRYQEREGNRRGYQLAALVHDGVGVWLAARRLNPARFIWAR